MKPGTGMKLALGFLGLASLADAAVPLVRPANATCHLQDALAGSWQLYTDQGVVAQVAPRSQPGLVLACPILIDPTGGVTGSGPCSASSGSWAVDGGTLLVDSLCKVDGTIRVTGDGSSYQLQVEANRETGRGSVLGNGVLRGNLGQRNASLGVGGVRVVQDGP